jgi:hypothetical protein
MGGKLSGHSEKTGLFFIKEIFDFDANVQKGALSIGLVFEADKEYVNG